MSPDQWMIRRVKNPFAAYGFACMCVLLAFGCRWLLDSLIGTRAPFMLFIPAAILAAIVGGFGPGLLVAMAGHFLGYYFFRDDQTSWIPHNAVEWVYIVMYDMVVLGCLLLVQSLHRAKKAAEANHDRARRQEEQLRTIVREMSAAQERIRDLAAIVESAEDAILTTDVQGKVLTCNAAAERLFGYPAKDILGKPVSVLSPESVRQEQSEMMARLMSGSGTPPIESTALTVSGKVLDVSVRPSALRDNAGKIIGASFILRDITELKRTNSALKETARRFRTMADAAPLMIWMTHSDQVGTWVNKTWRVLTGRNSELETPEGWREPVHPEDRPAWEQALETAARKRQSFEIEYRLRQAGGEYRRVLDRGVPRIGEQGEYLGLIGSCIDVTEWKEAELALEKKYEELRSAQQALRSHNEQLAASRQELENERARYRELFDSAPVGYVITTREGLIQQVNQAAADLFGESPEFLRGFPLARLLAKTNRPEFFANIGRLTRGEVSHVPNWEILLEPHHRKAFPCSVTVNLVQDREHKVTALRWIFRDITERREAEQRILRLNTELEARVRDRTAALEAANRELEAFSYSVSHDLRAPLRSINGFSKAVLEDYGDRLGPEGVEYLGHVLEASVRMGRLIEDLLELSRVSRGHLSLKEVNLTELARVVGAEVRARNPGSEVELAIQPDLRVWADVGLLRIVMENLMGNAWKFTSGKDRARVEVGSSFRDGRHTIYVRDNGAGFDMNHSSRLFSVFQRLHTQQEFAGTGIGLATVKRIIARHDGQVWAEGKPGEGATFFFSLPAAPPGAVEPMARTLKPKAVVVL